MHTIPSFAGGVPVWRGTDLGQHATAVQASGWAQLDHALPGGGWPCNSLAEILCAQAGVLEWRLLTPALRALVAAGKQLIAIAPPYPPHMPGLLHEGLSAHQLVWVQAHSLPDRLWACRQLLQANAAGALLLWLPAQVRPQQVRSLQIAAQAFDGLVFVFRPAAARQQASAAPLRVLAQAGPAWSLQLHILKRRGPLHGAPLHVPSVPGGLSAVLLPQRLAGVPAATAAMPLPLVAPHSRNSHAVAGLAARRPPASVLH